MRDLILQLSKSSIYSTKPDRVFEFEHAVEAWRYFESQQHTGKVVITMN
ncbi:zinc-binding dehydrogenase [Klebsiella pneumoniae]